MQEATSEIDVFFNILKPPNNILDATNAENYFKITGNLKLRRQINLYIYFTVNLTNWGKKGKLTRNVLKISAKREIKYGLDHIFYIFD